ncbi:hypothetical protein ScPMuIL_015828 [Solemya velum]
MSPIYTITTTNHAYVEATEDELEIGHLHDPCRHNGGGGHKNIDCQRWTLCCTKAAECCERQIETRNTSNDQLVCPRTWDGYGCFDDTPVGTNAEILCPSYIEQSQPTATAYKYCTSNGTWWRNPNTDKEWTDYTTCVVQIENLRSVVYVGLACKIFSLILLVPACCVFLSIRQLRNQQRIKLHLGLFFSLVLTVFISLLWDMVVYRDRLDQPDDHSTIMYQNSAGCKLLYVLLRYSVTSNYFWMVCEGFYLHRLIVNAFEVPKYLFGYHIYGWGLSWVPVLAYSSVRLTVAGFDQKCWVDHAGNYEWIIYIPNLMCVLVSSNIES